MGDTYVSDFIIFNAQTQMCLYENHEHCLAQSPKKNPLLSYSTVPETDVAADSDVHATATDARTAPPPVLCVPAWQRKKEAKLTTKYESSIAPRSSPQTLKRRRS
jgi:hypothetical protein